MIDQPIFVTGGSGYIGSFLLDKLAAQNRYVRVSSHSRIISPRTGVEDLRLGDLTRVTNFDKALNGCSAVVHLAGRAHVFGEREPNSDDFYSAINTGATLALARAAARSGVQRFVFISTVGVHGEISEMPLREAARLAPANPYTRSKLEAEKGLGEISRQTGMPITILRPTIVYGPGCPGNIRRLSELVARRIPLPFAALKNRRSMVSVRNLVEVIAKAVDSGRFANEVFLVADQEVVAIPTLVRNLARGLDVRPRLFPMPKKLLMAAAHVAGIHKQMQKLCGNLEVDTTHLRKQLHSFQVISTSEGLIETGGSFRPTSNERRTLNWKTRSFV